MVILGDDVDYDHDIDGIKHTNSKTYLLGNVLRYAHTMFAYLRKNLTISCCSFGFGVVAVGFVTPLARLINEIVGA